MTNLEKFIFEFQHELESGFVSNGNEKIGKLLKIIKLQSEELKKIENVASAFSLNRSVSYVDFELRHIAREALKKTEQIAGSE